MGTRSLQQSLFYVLFCTFFLLIASNSLSAQFALKWIERDFSSNSPTMASSGAEEIVATASDTLGNVYGIGLFRPGSTNTCYYCQWDGNAKIEDITLYKYDPKGTLLWRTKITGDQAEGGYGRNFRAANEIVILSDGIAIAGYCALTVEDTTPCPPYYPPFLCSSYGSPFYNSDQLDFYSADDLTTPAHSITSANNNVKIKGFVAKYSFDGDFERVTSMRSSDSYKSQFGFEITDLAADENDQIYIQGMYYDEEVVFCGTQNCPGGTRKYLRRRGCKTLTGYKIFVAKYNEIGTNQWAKGYAFLEDENNNVYSGQALSGGIAVDQSGIYLTGEFTGRLYQEYSAGSFTPYNSLPTCPTLPHYYYFPDEGEYSDYPSTFASSKYENTYSPGTFYYSKDAYVMKLNRATGGTLWRSRIGGNGDQYGRDIKVQNNNLYLAMYSNTFWGGAGNAGNRFDSLKLTASTNPRQLSGKEGRYHMHTLKILNGAPTKFFYDSDPGTGTNYVVTQRDLTEIEWSQRIDASYNVDFGRGRDLMVVDAQENIYHTGNIGIAAAAQYYLYPSTYSVTYSNPEPIPQYGGYDMLLVKYNKNGRHQYVKTIGLGDDERGQAISISPKNGDIFLGGYFERVTDFEPNTTISNTLTTYGLDDGFIACYGCFIPDVTSESDTFCVGESTTLKAHIACPSGVCNYVYEWINQSTNTLISTPTPKLTFTPTSPGTDKWVFRATDLNTDCVSEDSLIYVVNPSLSITATPTSVDACYGDTVNFSANAVPSSGVKYTWYRNTDSIKLGQNLYVSDRGTYRVVGSLAGCEASTVVTLNNYSTRSPRIVPDTPSVCGGGGAYVEVLDCPGCSYTWTPPLGSGASSSNSWIVADIAGTYTVNASDAFGCDYELDVDVINAGFLLPPIQARDAYGNSISTICNGKPLIVETTHLSACPTCTYQWSDGSTGPYTFAFGANAFQVTVTDNSTGCIGVSSVLEIKNSSLPNPSVVAGPVNVCDKDSAVVEVTAPCAGCLYEWFNNTPASGVIVDTGSLIKIHPFGDYYVKVTDSLGCTETSSVVEIGSAIANKPPINATTTKLCKGLSSNTTTLSTIDCSGCSYQWFYHNTAPNAELMISGVIDGGMGNGEPKAIELYAAGQIPDLSKYNLYTTLNYAPGPPITGTNRTLNFPAINVSPGSYIYIANNRDSFINYFGFPPTFVSNVIGTDGLNDSIALRKGATTVDAYLATGSAVFTDGYAYRNVNTTINNGAFNVTNWTVSTGSWSPPTCPTNTTCGTPFPIGTYSTSLAVTGIAKYEIPNTDSSGYTTGTTGVYSVEVTYENSCIAESDTMRIDTGLFVPQIGGFKASQFVTDTIYICNGKSSPLTITGVFQAPSAWSYQWYKDVTPISGATGYRHNATTAGVYYLEVTNEYGCVGISNRVEVISSSVGANPVVAASSLYRCAGDVVNLSVNTCGTCTYQWNVATPTTTYNTVPASIPGATNSSLTVTESAAYYMDVTESESGCVYTSSLITIKDTVLPAPIITFPLAPATTACSEDPVLLSIDAPCPGTCTYEWFFAHLDSSQFNSVLVGQQSVYSADSSGKYYVVKSEGNCISGASNAIPVTFKNINATLIAPPVTSVCNSTPVTINALPDTSCSTCGYQWYRNNVKLSAASIDTYNVALFGDYQVVVTDTISSIESCKDTSNIITFIDVSLATEIRSANAVADTVICGNSGSVNLEVDTCLGCTYQWYLNGNTSSALLTGATNFDYTIVGKAAAGTYYIGVSKLGCTVFDSMYVDSVPGVTVAIDTNTHTSVCAGDPIILRSDCDTCIKHQWYLNGNALPSGITVALSIDSTGNYQVLSTDSTGCSDLSPIVSVQEVDPPTNFALNFDAVSPIPVTYGTLSLDNYLQPASLRSLPIGPNCNALATATACYSSFTAGGAITSGDSIVSSVAGPGLHIINYRYKEGNCLFNVSDTLEILSPVNLTVANLNPAAPLYEACISDVLRFTLTNFTFQPTEIIFSTDNNNTITVTSFTSNLSPYAGVWSGDIDVVVPAGVRTGKVTLTDGTSSYVTKFFVVIQNPVVSMNLAGIPTPLCSNQGNVQLVGIPIGGTFLAEYSSGGTSGGLINSTNDSLVVDSVINYTNGVQNLDLIYEFVPTYTGTTVTCPDTIRDTLGVAVRDAKLDSVIYTPVSISQGLASMDSLTKIVWPLTSRDYTGNYSGTYVASNNILPNTITSGPGNEPVTYTLNNGGCSNAVTTSVPIWEAPTVLDSIPDYLCRSADTICIIRDRLNHGRGILIVYRGDTMRMDDLYTYSDAVNTTYATDLIFAESMNIMEVSSTNGGLDSISFGQGSEVFYFIPSKVTGNSTTLSFKFKYRRYLESYFGGSPGPEVTYDIAQVRKTIYIENPVKVEMSPAIIADTVFCQENTNYQFTGLPISGQYYLDNGALAGNVFNPTNYLFGSHDLKYVYEGNACSDSTAIGIYIPEPFTIDVVAPNGPEYCESEPNDTITFNVLTGTPSIDTSSAMLLVGGIQSGILFQPSRGEGVYPITYKISDIYGCQEMNSTTLTIHALPTLTMVPDFSTVDTTNEFCLNDLPREVTLTANGKTLTNWGGGTVGYSNGDLAMLNGPGILNGGNQPGQPLFEPDSAGVGYHYISYNYIDSNGCGDSITRTLQVKALPILSLTTVNGDTLSNEYCENDSIPLFGSPSNPIGSPAFGSEGVTPSTVASSLSIPNSAYMPNIPGITPATATETIYYRWTDVSTGCMDTIRKTLLVRNFTTDAVISGLDSAFCAASNPEIVGVDPGAGPIVTGVFTASDSALIQMPAALSNTATFYPDSSAGPKDQENIETIYFTYTSNGCTKTVDTTIVIWPLPQLGFFNPLGDSLSSPKDPRLHICQTSAEVPMIPTNTYYNSILFLQSPDPGIYQGQGIKKINGGTPFESYNYAPAQVTQGNLDTIVYTYTDTIYGCVDSLKIPIIVDTLPELSLGGLTNFDSTIMKYVYCENYPNQPVNVVPSPFGVDWKLSFNNQSVKNLGIPFALYPDTLAVTGVNMTYPIEYTYIGQKYFNGGFCGDTLLVNIEVRPKPVLQLVNVPDEYCVRDSAERILLTAIPTGGIFDDITVGVTNGILADSLFDPMAQQGERLITYTYTDTNTTCTETLFDTITVYNFPQVYFDMDGGCEGDTLTFLPGSTGLVNNGVAIDSLTTAIWNYGDGQVDTIRTIPNPIVVPNHEHIYTSSGVYYPTLTLQNRNQCDTSFTKRIVVSPKAQPTAGNDYFEDFQASHGNWFQETIDSSIASGIVTDSLWQWSQGLGVSINTQFSGNIAWVTNAGGAYGKGDQAWVYSPCFDLSALNRPMIELSYWKDTRPGVDGAAIEYYDSKTLKWTVLGRRFKGINWYDKDWVVSGPGAQSGAPIGWSGASYGWKNARYRLDTKGNDLRGQESVRFRVAFSSSKNTVLGGEGFAFDSVRIGERTRSVLVEHFSSVKYPGIASIEDTLYGAIYNSLYGRDVHLIQYHTGDYGKDDQYNLADADSDARILYYGITNPNQVRVNGENHVSTTDSLVYYKMETLDMQMLKDPKFSITYTNVPALNITGNQLSSKVIIKALDNMPSDDYSVFVSVTEDSVQLQGGANPHYGMAVNRKLLDGPYGYIRSKAWTLGDVDTISPSWNFSTNAVQFDKTNFELVTFIQNKNTKEVYQVNSTRNLTIFAGSVDSVKIIVEELENKDGIEITTMQLYPNPAQNAFNVEFDKALEGDYQWRLVDAIGQRVREGEVQAGTDLMQVNTAEFPSGMYIFSIYNDKVYTQRKVLISRH